MSEYKLETDSALETEQLAQKLATLLKPGDVVTLEGDLGAGKTTFTKGIANGLGVKRNVSSPTFTIIKEYEGELPLYHMDVYRLENSDEDIGFEEYFNGNGVSVVEWAQFIEEYLPDERLNIKINYVDEHTRELELRATSTHFEWVINELVS
ncbi:tRNA (adenosine(37)-N6)-threonylcarbamoyltransferase complex ATPase subunit type 1 TsaE [Virgibacillus profundi]|uniref:tRNA threonylcarbamoyladenosine biosynthesis protein TsaE n=1 Tax=Virgibacillus profundi TaxID=2024555 RepID=A0A2A2I7Q8_9BACI|nr:tRNA (adenosine(37)-N6)-threonylcarbamoyltransferase complex ATPase subunit type 1 TsaE [Virgibacillus profundi]PAV27687.1 tRNA (adenosine(37)-N6)-threonylcarbamoyltransferase complex ATPase subunit type 1 TsaE [Virgibacillus profundi]PXY51842.1 tRNA (adenosine(37)-N6)-threonylcarbamoyltransferase complex ATPase subunit type 1 TsaE [Virgibacillus profundi]